VTNGSPINDPSALSGVLTASASSAVWRPDLAWPTRHFRSLALTSKTYRSSSRAAPEPTHQRSGPAALSRVPGRISRSVARRGAFESSCQWVTLPRVGCFGTLGLRMPRVGPWRRRGHQDVYVQMLFYEVAESWAVDELDPIVLLGFDPASRREP
jgi:hypothetical protein